MTKRAAYLIVGLPHGGGTFLPAALHAHGPSLEEAGLRQPARSADEMFRASVEIRRDHQSWGLRRRDVEGAWSGVCRRADRSKGDIVVGHELLAAAGDPEIALLVDRLPGFDVHVVVAAGPADPRLTLFPDDYDLGAVLDRWAAHVRSPDRVHLLVTDPGDLTATWAALGRVVGFDAGLLPLPADLEVTADQDLGALRLLASSAGLLATVEELRRAAEEWAKTIAEGGYDVQGDLGGLAPSSPHGDDDEPVQARLDLVSGALAETVAELARLRREHAQLQVRAAKLQKKRRRLKRRLADATGD
ncbi:hypothetical protein [Nocardioides sp. W7]|uniref:hypothetical protein n=1 Tax=Nocardioides sp. W7 TaxID=2931390 RepID=UPI001FCFACB2|nr:hypothetical protein [Nocardioides sp. W7]